MGFVAGFGLLILAIMFIIGLAFLVPGIVGTAITGKIKHSPKVLRVLSIISMVIGILLCMLAILIPVCIFLLNYIA